MRLLTLPLTLARLPFKIAGTAISVVGGLIQPEQEEQSAAVRAQPQPRFVRENGGAPPSPAPAPVEPAHVEGHAGAEVHMDEPWAGYGRMNAADIKARLRSEPATVAAAVSLFEASGKGRTSVLEAAARRTRA